MCMEIEQAVSLLKSHEKNTLAVVNRGESRVFTRRGVAPLLELLNSEPNVLRGASVADKVTGAATAFMLVYGGAKRLHTGVISRRAAKILSEYSIEFTADTVVENIINRTGDGFCPMELAVKDIDEPAEAVRAVVKKLDELSGSV